ASAGVATSAGNVTAHTTTNADADPDTSSAVDPQLSFPEVNIYICPDHLILCLPDAPCKSLELATAGVITRFSELFDRADEHESWLNRMLYIALDSLIASQAAYLENLEDQVETMLDAVTVLKKPTDEMFEQIRALRRTVYAAKKALRALDAVSDALICNESSYIQDNDLHLFRSVATRCTGLASLSASVYSLTDGLLHTYEAKISDHTNDMVNRLTSITILMGIWSLVAGVYGMNFQYIPLETFQFGYFICIGVLIIVTIVLAIVFHRRKLL
ncbi:MAG: hypothetical protein LBM21_02610, partial [Coriobacteriales bacterium]|nr:hypothetical protein [Coriobacteriales bacterium]